MRRRLVVLAIFAGLGASLVAQGGNTGRLVGTVVTGDSSAKPVRRAIVTLGGSGLDGRSAVTDDDGRFEFDGLPAGRFTLTAAKPAYLTTAYGASGPGRPGTAVTLAAGQTVEHVTVALARGAVISGTIRDRTGEPAQDVQVLIQRVTPPSPSAGSAAALPTVVTDDRGVYRAFGLTPGAYLVAALPRMSAVSGLTVRTEADVDAAMRRQQARAAIGGGRPSTQPSSPATPSETPSPLGPSFSYPPLFYPGTPSGVDATPIVVALGEERDGIDIALELAPAASIQGVVVNPGGALPELDVRITPDGPSVPAAGRGGLAQTANGHPGLNGDGSFEFLNVTPGHYTVTARSANSVTTLGPGRSSSSRSVDPRTVPQLWASAEVTVNGGRIEGLTLRLQPALTLSGRVAFDAPSNPKPSDLTRFLVALSPVGVSALPGQGGSASLSAVRADGTFEIVGLMPGQYALTATAPGAAGLATWWLRSADIDGQDVLDTVLSLGASSGPVRAVLTFSDQHAELSGTLRQASGQPAPGYLMVLFPADRALWRSGSRRMRSVRPADDGHYTFAEVVPGQYLLAALAVGGVDDWQDPAVLEEIVRFGVGVSITSGAKTVQDVQIAGG